METPIKVEAGSGSGYVVINGQSWPKGLVPVTPLGNGQIQLGLRQDTICVALFSEYLDDLDEPFATEQAALDHLNGLCFSTGGSGVTSTDVSSMVEITQAAYDALDPKVSDTLYLIPEE